MPDVEITVRGTAVTAHSKDREVLVHRAEVQFRVRFGGTDSGTGGFAALNAWLGEVVTVDDAEVRHVEWSLTEALRDQLTGQVRSEAVGDAQRRAAGYARDLGLTTVRPVAVADPGLLGVDGERGGRPMRHAYSVAAGVPAGGGMHVDFRPEDIEVHAAVDMRFVADMAG